MRSGRSSFRQEEYEVTRKKGTEPAYQRGDLEQP